jgi:hypothetical protein
MTCGPSSDRSSEPGRPGLHRDERGEVIILVIAILVVVGILVGALASLATPIFAHATVVQKTNNSVAATDSGIEYGIRTMQSFFNSNPGASPPFCPSGAGQPLRGVPNAVNNQTPNVTCATLSSSGEISLVALTSTAGVGRTMSARAVVQVNELTGATTIESWRTCQDPSPTC